MWETYQTPTKIRPPRPPVGNLYNLTDFRSGDPNQQTLNKKNGVLDDRGEGRAESRICGESESQRTSAHLSRLSRPFMVLTTTCGDANTGPMDIGLYGGQRCCTSSSEISFWFVILHCSGMIEECFHSGNLPGQMCFLCYFRDLIAEGSFPRELAAKKETIK